MALNGFTVSFTRNGPNIDNVYYGSTVVVGSGVELGDIYNALFGDIEGDVITLYTDASIAMFFDLPFNGAVLSDINGVLPDFGGLTVLQNNIGYDVSLSPVEAGRVGINIAGLTFNSEDRLQLRLELTPSDMALAGQSVNENAGGAVIGDLTVTDLNDADTHTFEVDDNRFEVVNGHLKLKSGIALNYEEESSVDVTVTATDSFGLQYAELFTIAVNNMRDRPTGADNTITLNEDSSYRFQAADFGFAHDEGRGFLAVRIETVPANGVLALDGIQITGEMVIWAEHLGDLTWTPDANASGDGLAAFTFRVWDDTGTAVGGMNEDAIARTMTFDVTEVNDAPSGADKTITLQEDTIYRFTEADFGFSDPDGNAFAWLMIETQPASGTLTLDGVEVSPAQLIFRVEDIPLLAWQPDTDANGAGLASLTFRVVDDGGTANGGVARDETVRTITFDVDSVNEAPTGADKTITMKEDTRYTFTEADFGFSDMDGDAMEWVIIDTIPGSGTLMLGDMVLTDNGWNIVASDIPKLSWQPDKDAHGDGLATLTFRVRDNGDGNNTDIISRTFTFDVTDVRDRIIGDKGNDRIRGTESDDWLRGHDGNDVLWGYGGDDILRSRGGNDKFWGGDGADRFVFSTGSGKDRIMDFETGIDKIDLRQWKAIEDFADLKSHAKNKGGDLWIVDGKDTLIIKDFSKGELDAGDFLI